MQQHMTKAMRLDVVALRSTPALPLVMAGGVDEERVFQHAPRLRLLAAHIDRVAVGVLGPEPAAEGVMRRVDLGQASLLQPRADFGDSGLIAAEAQMIEALFLALDQKDLILGAALAAEGQDTVALGRQQPEGRIEFMPGRQIGHGQRVAQQRLHGHSASP